jgi:hypothetical protein
MQFMRTMQTTMIAAALLAGTLSTAGAQTTCPEGRTALGSCVRPDLAQAIRKNTIVETQSKLSFTAPPVLPSEDYEYRPLPDFKGAVTLFGTDRRRR